MPSPVCPTSQLFAFSLFCLLSVRTIPFHPLFLTSPFTSLLRSLCPPLGPFIVWRFLFILLPAVTYLPPPRALLPSPDPAISCRIPRAPPGLCPPGAARCAGGSSPPRPVAASPSPAAPGRRARERPAGREGQVARSPPREGAGQRRAGKGRSPRAAPPPRPPPAARLMSRARQECGRVINHPAGSRRSRPNHI